MKNIAYRSLANLLGIKQHDCQQEKHCQKEFLFRKKCKPRYRDANVYEEDKNYN